MFTRRTLASLLAPPLVVSALLVDAPASEAAAATVTGTVSMVGGIVSSGCDYRYLRYDLHDIPDATAWAATVDVYSPSGVAVGSSRFGGTGPTDEGFESIFVCDATEPGRYRVSTTVETYGDSPASSVTTQLESSTALRAPRTRTTLMASDLTPRAGQRLRLRVHSFVESTIGTYLNAGHAVVSLQLRYRGEWLKYRRTTVETNNQGQFVYVFRHWDTKRKWRIRAVTAPADFTTSVSPAVRIAKPHHR